MKGLHKCVPKKTYKLTYHLPEEFVRTEDCYHCILFVGDQLTVCRSHGAQTARCNDDVAEKHFEGLIPVTEDWHTRITLMRVSPKCGMYITI